MSSITAGTDVKTFNAPAILLSKLLSNCNVRIEKIPNPIQSSAHAAKGAEIDICEVVERFDGETLSREQVEGLIADNPHIGARSGAAGSDSHAPCPNRSRGCRLTSDKRIISLHQRFCTFVNVENNRIRGSFNILRASNLFRPFCNIFKQKGVIFLFKISKRKNSLLISSGDVNRATSPYIISCYSESGRCILSEKGITRDTVLQIPAGLVKRFGPVFKYRIKLFCSLTPA